MGRPATLKIDILADAKGVGKGVADADSKLSRLGKVGAKVGKLLAVGLAAGAAASVVVGRALIQAGERASTANAAIGNITKSMDLFGNRADQVSARVIKMAEATARQTGVDTNAIKVTQAKLMTFGELAKTADRVGGAFDRATLAAVDMAAAGFGTAEANAVQLGKALNDPVKGIAALAKSGVTFTETEKARIKTLVESNKIGEAQALVLAAIEKQVGGTAAATANGSDKMKVAFEQVKERLGLRLMPLFDRFATFVATKLLPGAERLALSLEAKLGPAFVRIGAFVSGTVIPAISSLVGFVDRNTGAVKALGITVGVVGAALLVYSTTVKVVSAATAAYAAVQAVLNGALRANPIGLVVTAVALLAAGLVTAYKRSETFRNIVNDLFAMLRKFIGFTPLGALIKNIDSVIDKIRQLKDVASTVGGAIGKLNPFSAAPLAPMGVPLSGGVPSFAPGGGLATAALGDPSPFALLTARSSGALVVDRRTIDARVIVDAALLDTRAVERLERAQRDQAVRLGQVTAYGGLA